MKKLKLNSNAFDKGEVLTRSQLKKVMGGDGSGGAGGNCSINYTSNETPPPGYLDTIVISRITVSGSSCADQQLACQQAASNIVTSGTGRNVHYDTDCDGIG